MSEKVTETLEFFSSLDPEQNITGNLDFSVILDKLDVAVQFILDKQFATVPQKRKFKHVSNRINCACPYCGDSSTDKDKKRGNIYKEVLWYKCYNCDKSTPLYKFIEDYGATSLFSVAEFYFLKKNIELGELSTITGFGGTRRSAKITDVFGIEEYAIPRSEIMKAMKLTEIKDNRKITDYLNSRLQIPKNGDVNHFAYDASYDILYVMNLTPDRNNVIGLQGRFNDKAMVRKLKIRFRSYQYSDIWKDFFATEIDDEIKMKMNRFSLIYNIMNVDYMKEIYIFEGAIDSHHMHNSIASLSQHEKIYLPNGRYFYDNTTMDKTGRDKSLELIQKKEYVFLWKKFLRDYPEYTFCKDLNDVMKKKRLDESVFKEYFNNNPLMAIFL